jgi:hypothetical protein
MVLLALSLATTNADDRSRRWRVEPNWVLERAQTGLVQGTPTKRLIIGRRQIDGYNQGGVTVWYERNNVVGITR